MKLITVFTNCIVSFFSLTSVSAKSGDALFRGCSVWVSKFTFNCPKEFDTGKGKRVSSCNCQNPEFLATYVDCINRAQNGDAKRAIESMVSACSSEDIRPGFNRSQLLDIAQNQTQYFVDVNTFKDDLTNIQKKKIPMLHPIKFTQAQIDQAYKSFKVGFSNKDMAEIYGGVIILYFGIILIIGMISNFVTRTMPKVTKSLFKVNLVILFRKRISLPALAGYRHDTPLKYGIFNASLPTRAQSIILFFYFTITVTFLSIGYDLYDGNTRYQTKTIQFTRYLGDRAGILATAHLPMIFLFAGRNNIMLWLTNWSFTTMSVYHKWISRMLFVLVAIHGACFYTHYKLLNKFQLMEELYVAWGIVAAISVTLIIVCSIRHIRERVYDLFLLGHQILVILFVVGAWRHLQPHGYLEWMYASIAIWAFDRVCRVARVALSGLRARANCKVYSNEIIKMKIDYSSTWLPRAGSYVFVSFLKPTWKFWESHPFSIYPSTVAGEENKLVVCLKKANGKTKQLVDYLSTNKESYDGGIIPVWLDGPYGQRFPIEKSDTVVFIAGGMGITAIYSYAVEMMKISEKKHLKFNWIIQDESYTDWFRDELEYLIMSGLMEVSIYISRSKKKLLEKGNINNNIDKSNSNNAKCQQQKNIEQEKIENHQQPKEWDLKIKSHIYYERPNLTGLVDSAISEAVPGSIAFMTCGPDRMNDEVRKIITSELKEGRGNIDLFTESFSY